MGFDKKTLISYGVQFVIAALIAYLVAEAQGLRIGQEAYLVCRYLSDGLFVSALVFVSFGALMWISTTGFFDIFSYAFNSLLVLFTPLKKPSEQKHYYEYKSEREAKRQGKPVTHTVLITGLIFLALSLLALMLYYKLMPAEAAAAL